MHEHTEPYQLVQPPQHVSLEGATTALLLARWHDRCMVLTDGQVSWVEAGAVRDWAPWNTAMAANA